MIHAAFTKIDLQAHSRKCQGQCLAVLRMNPFGRMIIGDILEKQLTSIPTSLFTLIIGYMCDISDAESQELAHHKLYATFSERLPQPGCNRLAPLELGVNIPNVGKIDQDLFQTLALFGFFTRELRFGVGNCQPSQGT